MLSRIAIVLGLSLVACGPADPGGGSVDAPASTDGTSGAVCTGATYDSCVDNTQCTAMNCHLFTQDAMQICTAACTPLDNTTCPVDKTGAHGVCNMRGICKPAAANDCTR